MFITCASQVTLIVKNPPTNTGDARDLGVSPGSGRPPREGNGSPLQYSCLENPMDRGAWRAIYIYICIVHGVAKSQTRLSDFHSLTHIYIHIYILIYVCTYVYIYYICMYYIHIYV